MLPGLCGCWARFPSCPVFLLGHHGSLRSPNSTLFPLLPFPPPSHSVSLVHGYILGSGSLGNHSQSPWLPACLWALFSKRSLCHCRALGSHCGQLVRPGTSLCPSPPPPPCSASSPSSTTLEHSSLTQAKAGFVKKLFPHECQCERVQLREWGLAVLFCRVGLHVHKMYFML